MSVARRAPCAAVTPEQQQTLSEINMELAPHGVTINAQPISFAYQAPIVLTLIFPSMGPQTRLLLASGRVI